MKIQNQKDALRISEIEELGRAAARSFRDEVQAALAPSVKQIEIDLSQTSFMDSGGLGALIGLHRTVSGPKTAVVVRLLNPTAPLQQLLELTRMNRLFEIVHQPASSPDQRPSNEEMEGLVVSTGFEWTANVGDETSHADLVPA